MDAANGTLSKYSAGDPSMKIDPNTNMTVSAEMNGKKINVLFSAFSFRMNLLMMKYNGAEARAPNKGETTQLSAIFPMLIHWMALYPFKLMTKPTRIQEVTNT